MLQDRVGQALILHITYNMQRDGMYGTKPTVILQLVLVGKIRGSSGIFCNSCSWNFCNFSFSDIMVVGRDCS